MNRRANAYVVMLLLLAGSALLSPQQAFAGSGGASPAGSGGSSTSPSSSSPTTSPNSTPVQPANPVVSATGNGILIKTRASVSLRNRLRFSGYVPVSDAGRVVEIQRLGHQTGWAWAPTTHATVQPDGSFVAIWPTNHIGRFQIRAVLAQQTSATARAGAASPTLTITVYRKAIATTYGPGFYGQQTACGQILHKTTIGVANRTLPCGSQVALYYGGKTIVVPVIDRGPYANHADWDLTEATASALGIDGTVTIGGVSLPHQP